MNGNSLRTIEKQISCKRIKKVGFGYLCDF